MDVMSRGIDIKEINMVINYDVLRDVEDYVYRIGRIVCVNMKGEVYMLINLKDMLKLVRIECLIEIEIECLFMLEELGVVFEMKVSVFGDGKKWNKKLFYRKKKKLNNFV